MDLQARKYQFIQELIKVQKSGVMDKLEALLKKELSKEIVAYSVDENPLTREEYRNLLKESESEYLKGDFTSQDDIEKESENW